ncbi:MAG: carboxypeptidase-like regulatory domain-containing protein, partial [bacterium]
MKIDFKTNWIVGLIFLLGVVISSPSYAQGERKVYTITGSVFDARTSEPLVGTNVFIEGTTFGAATNIEGKYSINALLTPGNYTLQFSFIGYKKETKTVQLAGEAEVEVALLNLAEDLLQTQEIVVTGTAVATEKAQLGHTISTVQGTAISEAQAPTIDAALVGKVAGAQIQQNSGTPGGGVTVRLRGTSTISTDADPLYIIDGVIVDNSSNELVNLGGYVGNRLADFDPNDIEHIEVVKGAAAAALYGSRANNGVIQIFTKRGRLGKPRITFKSRVGVSNIRKTLATNAFPFDANGNPVERFDNQDFIFRTGSELEEYLSISGGSERTKYFVSGSVSNQEGIEKANDYTKVNVRVNADQLVTNWLNISVGAN